MTENVNCSTIPRVRRLLLIVMALAASLALWSVLFGGVQLRFGGMTLRSHDPVRPLILAVVLFFVYGISFRAAFQRGGGQDRAPLPSRAVWTVVICAVAVFGAFAAMVDVLGRPDPTPPATSARRTAGSTARCPTLAGERQPSVALCHHVVGSARIHGVARPAGNRSDLRAGIAADDGRFSSRGWSARSIPCGPDLCRPDGVVDVRARSSNRRGGGWRDGDTVCRREPDRDVPGVVADDRRADWRAVDGCGGGVPVGITMVAGAERPPRGGGCHGPAQPAAPDPGVRAAFPADRRDVARGIDSCRHVRHARGSGGHRGCSTQLTLVRESIQLRVRLSRPAVFDFQHLAEPAAVSGMAGAIALRAVAVVPAPVDSLEAADGEPERPPPCLLVGRRDMAVVPAVLRIRGMVVLCGSCCPRFRRS